MPMYRPENGRVACYVEVVVTPEEIKKLRATLRCTAKELAATLNIPLSEVQAWEAAERFPTKQWVSRMEQLDKQGPVAVVRSAKKASQRRTSGMAKLEDPELWAILRKLISYPELFGEVSKLAAPYADPSDRDE
jgi:DNA-binding transcriptional regulator YiaG